MVLDRSVHVLDSNVMSCPPAVPLRHFTCVQKLIAIMIFQNKTAGLKGNFILTVQSAPE